MSEERETEKLITKEDSHFVFIRPKAIINSSGSTWASETVRLRQRHPDEFEVKENDIYSIQFRQVCAAIHNACFLYADMTEQGDVSKAKAQNDCIYTNYECERLQHLKRKLEPYITEEGIVESEVENQIFSCGIKSKLLSQTSKIYN